MESMGKDHAQHLLPDKHHQTFTTDGSMVARHSYKSDWIWTWYICPSSTNLYQQNNTQWNEYNPTMTCRTYAIYPPQPACTRDQLPRQATPVTPMFIGQAIRIDLPAASIYQASIPQAQPTLWIHQQITTPPTQWDSKLWSQIQGQMQLPDLYQNINSR